MWPNHGKLAPFLIQSCFLNAIGRKVRGILGGKAVVDETLESLRSCWTNRCVCRLQTAYYSCLARPKGHTAIWPNNCSCIRVELLFGKIEDTLNRAS